MEADFVTGKLRRHKCDVSHSPVRLRLRTGRGTTNPTGRYRQRPLAPTYRLDDPQCQHRQLDCGKR